MKRSGMTKKGLFSGDSLMLEFADLAVKKKRMEPQGKPASCADVPSSTQDSVSPLPHSIGNRSEAMTKRRQTVSA